MKLLENLALEMSKSLNHTDSSEAQKRIFSGILHGDASNRVNMLA